MKPQIAVYYFPNYHVDALNEQRHGKNWTEWELVRAAVPRFTGHYQPRVPLWGYEDEADPKVMERKINYAVNAGIDTFIFDWYWYKEGEFLSGCLKEGFLRASNRNDMKFALMWANHDWTDIHPAKRFGRDVQYSGVLTEEKFLEGIDCALEYMKQPNYWQVQGGKYFSIYDVSNLLRVFGSIENAKTALVEIRKRAERAGVGKLHLNVIALEAPILPGETQRGDLNELSQELGFDSVGSYVWVHHHCIPQERYPYEKLAADASNDYAKFRREYQLPYLSNVTVGWDSSPRAVSTEVWEMVGYPFCPMTVDGTPEQFEEAFRKLYHEVAQDSGSIGAVTINAWNEWTEGSYLEPDEKFGYGYLEAVRRVKFGDEKL